MKPLLFLLVFLSISVATSTFAVSNSGLVGTWKMVDLRCDNGATANAEVKEQILEITSDAKLIFKADGSYSFSSGHLNTIGTYVVESPTVLKMTVSQNEVKVVDYELNDNELLMYQPLGYLRGQLCGKDSRGIQVLKKQRVK